MSISCIGIRYATAQRLCPPQMALDVNSAQEAEQQKIIAPQLPSRLDAYIGLMNTGLPMSEDCLRLSIFTPSLEGRRPVLVWIHGGAFLTGSGLYERYDATELSDMGDIVVVNISYRLGVLGFSCIPEQNVRNLGLQDQACALRWIRRNITHWGGNPERITVFGQSAGAYSVACHLATLQEPLFQRAILASAPFFPTTQKSMARNTKRFLKVLGKPVTEATLDEILAAQKESKGGSLSGMPYCPVCPDLKNPKQLMPGLKKVLLWNQQDDASLFVPFQWLNPIVTRLVFRQPMLQYAHTLQTRGIDVRTLQFFWRHGSGPSGAAHCIELPLIFGDWEHWKDAPFLQGVDEEEYTRKVIEMKHLVIDFVTE